MDAIQVALAQQAAEQQRHHPKGTFFWVWGVLLIYTVLKDFDVGLPVTAALCLIALYVAASDSAIRLLRSLTA